MIFNDFELKQLLKWIEMYQKNEAPSVKERALMFLSLELGRKLPTLTIERTRKFVDSLDVNFDSSDDWSTHITSEFLKSNTFEDKQHNNDPIYQESGPEIENEPEKDSGPEIPEKEPESEPKIENEPTYQESSRKIDQGYRIPYARRYLPTPRTSSTEYFERRREIMNNRKPLSSYEMFTRRARLLEESIDNTSSQIEEIEKSLKNLNDTKPYSVDWMSRTEKASFEGLTPELKKMITERYDTMVEQSDEEILPLRFQVLNSELPNNTKMEIFDKLENQPMLSDNSKYLNYVKSLLKIPMNKFTPFPTSLISDPSAVTKYIEDCNDSFKHEVYGHDIVKNEFLTMIGSWLKTGYSNEYGNVIGVSGPVGVGKTTLIKDGLAKALNRPFYFISLGGTSYSSFLTGHGYTYEGSTYGEIARGLIETKCMDPIFYFDELDKISTDSKGEEIVHALIHLTDPAQNNQFHDRYFAGVDLDVSRSLFVFSYNDPNKVNPILRDRIHEILLDDFDIQQKTDIALTYILPKMCKTMEICIENLLQFEDGVIEHLVELCEDNTGMRKLKLILVRMLRILNLAYLTKGETILNLDKSLLPNGPPYIITTDIISYLFNFCQKDKNKDNESSISNFMMYM